MKIQKKIDVWLVRKGPVSSLRVVQYDTGVQLIFNVLDYDLPSGTTATLYLRKKSGKFIYQTTGITIDGNTITVDLENQALTEHGKAFYQLRLMNGDDIISTFYSSMWVDLSLANADAVESKTVISAFDELTLEKIAEIEAATAEFIAQAQAKVADKGVEVLATIPDDYTATSRTADSAIRTKADAIICSAGGNAVVISDSSNDYLRGLKVFGKTTQKTTTGKNLLQITAQTATVNGITFTVNDDGSVTANGTATDLSTLVLNSAVTFESGVTYALSGCPSGGGANSYRIDNADKIADDGNGGSTQYSTATEKPVRIRIASGVTVNNLVFRPMLRLASVGDDTFEPYTGGKASPNREYPQSFDNLSKDGYVNIDALGKNLAYSHVTRDVTYNGITIKAELDKSEVVISGTAEKQHSYGILRSRFLPVGKYTISAYGLNIADSTVDRIYVMSMDSEKVVCNYVQDSKPKTFEITAPGEYRIDLVFGAGSTYENRIVKVQVEKGENATEYEPFKGASLAIPTDGYFPGVPTVSGGDYTDADGQQWIADAFDFERGVYVRKIQCDALTGTEDFVTEYNTLVFKEAAGVAIPHAYGSGVLCSHASPVLGLDGMYIFIPFEAFGVTTVSGLKSAIADLYANGTPVEIMYALPEPEENPLDAMDIEAFKAISSHYPNTTVLNDSGAYMEVKYNADTKTFIENLLSGVSATRIADVELLASAWEDTELSYLYAQVINIPGTTEFSQVNLNPSVEQMAIFYEKNLSFMTENEDGVVTVYAIGQKPMNDYVIQTAIREVRV